MNKSLLLVVVILGLSLLASFMNAEVIVQDQFDNLVGLPLTGGNDTGGYTVNNPSVPTSPYILQVIVSDGSEPGFGPTHEVFWLLPGTPLFGNATLTNMYFVPSGSSTPQNTTLGSPQNPNSGIGTYFYIFTIPVNGFVQVNITYNSTAPLETDLIFIQVANPASVQTHIVGDPQFIGLRGQSYQVHGVDGAVYNIISEANTQVNSRFVFLSEGQCPIFNGVADNNCWSHPGSYLGELSFQQVVDGKIHAGLVTAGSAKDGFSAIQMDGHALKVGDTITYGTFSLSYISTHRVKFETEHFSFDLSNSDYFVNQAVRVKTSLNRLTSHGLLGQTHSNKVYATATRYIEGNVDDYIISDNDIFGDDFVYNQFQVVQQ
jgi:hypothetical protein